MEKCDQQQSFCQLQGFLSPKSRLFPSCLCQCCQSSSWSPTAVSTASQNSIWYGFNVTGQTILVRGLRVFISELLLFLGSLFQKDPSCSVLAPVVPLVGPSISRAKSCLPKEPPGETQAQQAVVPGALGLRMPPVLRGISPGQSGGMGRCGDQGAKPGRLLLRRIPGPAGKENHLP